MFLPYSQVNNFLDPWRRERKNLFSIFTQMHDSLFPRFSGIIIGWVFDFFS